MSGSSKPEIVLDISRLISRVLHATPTGVDRVEMAYARHLLQLVPDRLHFAALNVSGAYGRIPRHSVEQFLHRTEALWSGQRGRPTGKLATYAAAADMLALTWPQRVDRAARPRVLLQASPHHLHNQAQTARIIQQEQAKFVCLLHDLIPIEFPEYARPDGALTHMHRIETVARLADGVITVSNSTKQSFIPYLTAARRRIPVEVATLAVDFPLVDSEKAILGDQPYFICLGTIEPRKNHLLLLNIWRRLVATAPDPGAIPRLIVIGRRGWENENIIDMLDRCPSLQGHVIECADLSDAAVRNALAGARALLMPSFAEGFGLPVAEAIAMGVPVVCSDLPALREAGGAVPDYLDPLDGQGWLKAITCYTDPHSLAREAQRVRRLTWTPATWSDHFQTVIEVTDRAIAGVA
ncbi:MAG: glycosyl transferase [Proteobacteria bacterium ST_bin14]|nr:MAG: glycosyl transferase [Proteobacteria bacterium ST_bin14]